VYIDYLQNGRGKLLVAPYCVRPLPGAPVSTPLRWREVEPGLDIRRFTIRSMLRRARALKADPLLPVLTESPDLLSALDTLHGRI
jgi:bifunctional non-homologous end joining protein LigD